MPCQSQFTSVFAYSGMYCAEAPIVSPNRKISLPLCSKENPRPLPRTLARVRVWLAVRMERSAQSTSPMSCSCFLEVAGM